MSTFPVRCAVFFLFSLSANSLVAGDATTAQFDGVKAKQNVAHLSRDELQGRMTCTDGFRRAADWAAERFQAWGLAPAGENGTYFQEVTIPGFDWTTGVPSLEVGKRAFPLDDGDFSLDSLSSPACKVKSNVVFVGYGISAPKKGLDEYQHVDVHGKVVVALIGSPVDAPEPSGLFQRSESASKTDEKKQEEEQWKEEATDAAKIKTAFDHGAAAILLYNPDETTSTDGRRRYYSRRSRGGDFQPDRDFLCFTINERIFREIMKQDPQLSPRGFTRQLDSLRREIKAKKAQSKAVDVQVALKGFDTKVRFDEEHKNNSARNVLAKIEGTDPDLKQQVVLAGAHLDHVGMRNGYVYNGADDNASGSAVVLELARVLAESNYQPKRTVIFCLWCGEERGLIGSNHYAKNPCDGVDMDRVVAYFNMDMVGMGTVLGAPGALNFPAIWKVICRDQDPELMKKVEPSVGGPGGSDHSGFIRQGIEALALMTHGGIGHPDYHQPEDDIEKIDPEMLRVTGQFVLQGIMNLAGESQANLLIPRRKELYEGLRMRITNLNPALEGSNWSLIDLKAENGTELMQSLFEHVREQLKEQASAESEPSREGRRRGGGRPPTGNGSLRQSINRGVDSLKAVGTDERLLDLIVETHGIGRFDLAADDPMWFQDGVLTDTGKALLTALEKRKVVIHFVSPTPAALKQLTDAASRPFVVSGQYELEADVTDSLKRLGCPLAVPLDPKQPDEFLTRVEELKSRLGERRLLFAMLQNAEKLDDVKQTIYMGLLDRGWGHDEIVGGREHGGLMGGATIRQLGQ